MTLTSRTRVDRIEFGDFQTPTDLAEQVAAIVRMWRPSFATIVEPTCGIGSMLAAAAGAFSEAREIVGIDVDERHISHARAALAARFPSRGFDLQVADFFHVDWDAVLRTRPGPVLVIGNPPWVTSSTLGAIGGGNLPTKRNSRNLRGIEALTGKSNFDIAEWMLLRLISAMSGKASVLAMLVKTAVARKVLTHAWQRKLPVARAASYELDASTHFGASVDACLLICEIGESSNQDCEVRHIDRPSARSSTFGLRDGALIADLDALATAEPLLRRPNQTAVSQWRSGVKHDCARVMELRGKPGHLHNGLGQQVELDPATVFPLLKGSQLANGRVDDLDRFVVITQRNPTEDTAQLARVAPNTWRYLLEHGDALDRRGSSIYRNRPRFAMFGIGPYSFAPWKVAICGLYKSLRFRKVGPYRGLPVVPDDTCSLLPCQTRYEAEVLEEMLKSELSQSFYRAFIFWDNKRPITIEVLQKLDLNELSRRLGRYDEWQGVSSAAARDNSDQDGFLF